MCLPFQEEYCREMRRKVHFQQYYIAHAYGTEMTLVEVLFSFNIMDGWCHQQAGSQDAFDLVCGVTEGFKRVFIALLKKARSVNSIDFVMNSRRYSLLLLFSSRRKTAL